MVKMLSQVGFEFTANALLRLTHPHEILTKSKKVDLAKFLILPNPNNASLIPIALKQISWNWMENYGYNSNPLAVSRI